MVSERERGCWTGLLNVVMESESLNSFVTCSFWVLDAGNFCGAVGG